MDLFNDYIQLPLEDADVVYYKQFLTQKEADILFDRLHKETTWRQDDIKVFGKVYAQPRCTALYAMNALPYSYSSITMSPIPLTKPLLDVKAKIDTLVQTKFTTCLLNLYRDGNDSNGWHADDEKELGPNPVIASLSLGATRRFKMRKKEAHHKRFKLDLVHGSLLIMKGKTQHTWQHQIPKTTKNVAPRINLTFRHLS